MIDVYELSFNNEKAVEHIDRMFEYFGKALDDLWPDYDKDTLIQDLHEENLCCLVVVDRVSEQIYAYSISQIRQYKTGVKNLHVYIVGGKHMEKWFDSYLSALELIAQLNNTDYITCNGRKGWQRYLKKYGYVTKSDDVVMKKFNTNVAEIHNINNQYLH